MKKILFILSIIFMIATQSCKKKFLDLFPYDQVALNKAITNEADMQAAVIGLYSELRNSNLYGRSLPLYGDIIADNVFISSQNSNRYIAELNYTYTNTNGDMLGTWGEAYKAILRANNIINAGIASSAVANQLKGEALAMRALMYFNLVNWYAKPYVTDPNSEGVPIVLSYDPLLKPSRAKLSEVYAQIDKDLNDAFGLMTITKNSSYVTKYVARALQARVALFKGDWNSAKTTALDFVNNGGYTLTAAANLVNYWKNPAPVSNKVETIFEITNDAVNNNGTNALAYFYDQGGYGDAIGSDDLYNQYSATDARKGLFITGTRAGQTVRIVNKYSNTSNAADKDDVKVIRYAEILLTLAEAYYRTSDEINARLYLNMLAIQRDPSFAGYASTGTQLLNDIIFERRKELAFEGMRYLDLQRLQLDVVRVNINNNYVGITPLTLPANNFKRIFPIPQNERDANSGISQNTGY